MTCIAYTAWVYGDERAVGRVGEAAVRPSSGKKAILGIIDPRNGYY